MADERSGREVARHGVSQGTDAAVPLTLGAIPDADGTSFRVWAPTTRAIELVLEPPSQLPARRALEPQPDGWFAGACPDVGPGWLYRYQLDGDGPFPDPASRFQPQGVHGASLVVDPNAFRWSDHDWRGLPLGALVAYELHVGTFSPTGTFDGVRQRLPYLRDLGVTALQLMPVADFPGSRNWGYDGAALFAPARCYGSPDDLRRLVDAAHGLGLAVLLDVVYNHTGPDGAYLSRFSPYYFTDRHRSPWGAGIDLDGEHSAAVRQFFIENALHWIREYHLDGLRLDATHAIHDDSPRHFLAELAALVHASVQGRVVHVIAEDHRNLATMLRPPDLGGWGLDAVWADDFHHQMRRHLAGDHDGYYRDFTGTTQDLATTLRQGWFFTGQYSHHLGEPRGTAPTGVPARRFVICLQNHDQVGNRAFGERLHHQIELAAFRAASVLLLMAPQTPLLFMGQEWAASSPFQYFTDHHEDLGRLVTAGRRREFQTFAAFSDASIRDTIPDPQALSTFLTSQLAWSDRASEPHASMERLYKALLRLRRQRLAWADGPANGFTVEAADEATLVMRRIDSTGVQLLVAVRLRGAGLLPLPSPESFRLPTENASTTSSRGPGWRCVLTSEDAPFSPSPLPPSLEASDGVRVIRFPGPSAVVLEAS